MNNNPTSYRTNIDTAQTPRRVMDIRDSKDYFAAPDAFILYRTIGTDIATLFIRADANVTNKLDLKKYKILLFQENGNINVDLRGHSLYFFEVTLEIPSSTIRTKIAELKLDIQGTEKNNLALKTVRELRFTLQTTNTSINEASAYLDQLKEELEGLEDTTTITYIDLENHIKEVEADIEKARVEADEIRTTINERKALRLHNLQHMNDHDLLSYCRTLPWLDLGTLKSCLTKDIPEYNDYIPYKKRISIVEKAGKLYNETFTKSI